MGKCRKCCCFFCWKMFLAKWVDYGGFDGVQASQVFHQMRQTSACVKACGCNSDLHSTKRVYIHIERYTLHTSWHIPHTSDIIPNSQATISSPGLQLLSIGSSASSSRAAKRSRKEGVRASASTRVASAERPSKHHVQPLFLGGKPRF